MCHAQAALLESILFHREGLTLTAPQLMDGVFAARGNSRLRKVLFDLMKRGIINIGIYHEITAPKNYHVESIWQYMNNIVFPRSFIFSSMPCLTGALGSGNKLAADKYGEVQKYLLSLAEGVPTSRPRVNDGSYVGEELGYFMDFMEEFASVERESDKSIYRIEKIKQPGYREFIENSLSDTADTAILFNMLSENDNAQLINELVSCERRSDCDRLLNGERFASLSCIDEIRAVMNALYNKHAMLAFADAEIHVPRLATADRRDILREALEQQNSGNVPAFRFSNTETIMESTDLSTTVMTVESALSVRDEVEAISKEQKLSWEESIEAFRTKTMLSAYGMKLSDDGEYMIELDQDFDKQYSFHSEPDYNASEKLDMLDRLKISRQDSFTT